MFETVRMLYYLRVIKAILFDMDGLIVDSEPLHFLAYERVFTSFGKKFLPSEHRRFLGISDTVESSVLVKKHSLSISPEELTRRKSKEYKELINFAKPKPGLFELLNYLKDHRYTLTIASGSTRKEIDTIIHLLKIEEFFYRYFSAEEVKNGKPFPDLFLHAAESLGINPRNCLVLEDAPHGIEAANAAGMQSIAILSDGVKLTDFPKKTNTLTSLVSVIKHLEKESRAS